MTSTARARVLAALMAVVAAAGIVAGEVLTAGWPLPITEWLFGAACMLLPAVGWLIAVRRSDNVYGWLLLASADCLGLGGLGVGLLTRNDAGEGLIPVLGALLASLYTIFYGLTWVFVPLLFSDGRLPSRGWRVGAWIAATSITVHWLGALLFPDEIWAGTFSGGGGNPLGLSGTAGLLAAFVGGTGQVATFIAGLSVLVSLIRRWWRSTSTERRRLRWMVAGSGVTLGDSC